MTKGRLKLMALTGTLGLCKGMLCYGDGPMFLYTLNTWKLIEIYNKMISCRARVTTSIIYSGITRCLPVDGFLSNILCN